MAKKKIKIPGLSKSVTRTKKKIAKATGIPTTKAGRQKKIGRLFGIK